MSRLFSWRSRDPSSSGHDEVTAIRMFIYTSSGVSVCPRFPRHATSRPIIWGAGDKMRTITTRVSHHVCACQLGIAREPVKAQTQAYPDLLAGYSSERPFSITDNPGARIRPRPQFRLQPLSGRLLSPRPAAPRSSTSSPRIRPRVLGINVGNSHRSFKRRHQTGLYFWKCPQARHICPRMLNVYVAV